MSAGEGFSCPWDGCKESFDTKRGRSMHHVHAHGESIAWTVVECDNCGDDVEKQKVEVERSGDRNFCDKECEMGFREGGERGTNKDELICENCGITFERYDYRQERENAFCSHSCRGEFYSGEDSPVWNGGYVGYYGSNWSDVRKRVLERDSHKCCECSSDYRPSVHHIVKVAYFRRWPEADVEDANVPRNLVTLCSNCHPGPQEDQRDCPKPPEHWSKAR